MTQLTINPKAFDDPEAKEAIRVCLAAGGPYVSLDLGWIRNEPTGPLEKDESWGYLLADLANHIANALSQDTGYPKEYLIEQIRQKFNREIDSSRRVQGHLSDG